MKGDEIVNVKVKAVKEELSYEEKMDNESRT